MSDLQCAARLVVARHGEAEYETELLNDQGGSLTRLGRRQAADLAASLAGERIAWIYTSSLARAVQTAEIVAAELRVGVTVREGLREILTGNFTGLPSEPNPFEPTFDAWVAGDLAARIDGAESGQEVVDRMAVELEAIADVHRGETALVVSHGGAIGTAIPQLARNTTIREHYGKPFPNCAVVRLDRDADGWLVTEWASGLRFPAPPGSGR